MPPRRRNARRAPIETPEPPMMDSATFQAAVTAAVAAAIAQINPNGTNGSGSRNGTNDSTNGETPNQPRVCTYKDFANCKPVAFHGTGGVLALTRWIEKTESIFDFSACPRNSRSNSPLVPLPRRPCPGGRVIGEIQKLEQELWNLTMKGSDLTTYTNRFNDLATLCHAMVTPESVKVERYIWGLSPQIQGNVESASPATFDSAKRLAQ
ncbi:hypothetical protein L2E82_31031 [Cichorium intybus]|uniref:Uncharacterized protein n=1 Tax=Cichorium intybus TaxID=13427 RepID=A0ACB9D279_CICIN|nr:hypothetical protein L2E82_31031 [Cichorium intybus]